MSGCLHSARWALSIFLIIVFVVLVLVGIPSIAITRSASSRDTVKTWLEESGIYYNAADTVGGFLNTMLNQGSDDAGQEGSATENGTPMADEEFQQELQDPSEETTEKLASIFTPEKLREMATEAIDGLYDWFEGKTAKPRIMIELVDDPEDLIEILTFGLDSKLESLPTCDPGVSEQQDFNPLEAECLPEGFENEDLEALITEHQSDEELEELNETMVLSTDDMDITAETTENVQSAYWLVKNTYLIILGIYFFLLILLLLLIPDFPAKLHVTGITTLLTAGVILVSTYFSTFLYDFVWENISSSIPEDQLSSLEGTIGSLTEVAMNDILNQVRIWSIGTMILGALLVTIAVVISLLKKKDSPVAPVEETPKYLT